MQGVVVDLAEHGTCPYAAHIPSLAVVDELCELSHELEGVFRLFLGPLVLESLPLLSLLPLSTLLLGRLGTCTTHQFLVPNLHM